MSVSTVGTDGEPVQAGSALLRARTAEQRKGERKYARKTLNKYMKKKSTNTLNPEEKFELTRIKGMIDEINDDIKNHREGLHANYPELFKPIGSFEKPVPIDILNKVIRGDIKGGVCYGGEYFESPKNREKFHKEDLKNTPLLYITATMAVIDIVIWVGIFI